MGTQTSHTPEGDDHVFFRGFSGKQRLYLEEDFPPHGPELVPSAPPRSKKLSRARKPSLASLKRSLSFGDAEFIATSVDGGDVAEVEVLYPDFPRSEPIYAVIDKSKKKKKKKREEENKDIPKLEEEEENNNEEIEIIKTGLTEPTDQT